MRTPCFLVALSLVTSLAHAQDPKPLSVSLVPSRGAALTAFVPRGWHIEKQLRGDLNRDKRPDAALVLVQNKPARDDADNPTARSRALVVALREGKAWRRVGFNNSVLYGTRDGGAFYGIVETPTNVSIQKGVIVVSQEVGSREVSETTYRFRFDNAKKRVTLIGYDQATRDRLSGDVQTISCNFSTGQKKTTTIDAKDNTTIKTTRLSRTLRVLESVDGEENF